MALLIFWVCWASTLAGDPLPSAFQRHSELGVQHFQQGRYRDALAEWLAAYALEPHPTLLLNIGQANLQLEQPTEAIRYYVMFLQAGPRGKQPGKQRQLAQAGLEKARAMEAEQHARAAQTRLTPPPERTLPITRDIPNLPADKPIYKRGLFWGTIGGVVATGILVGVMAARPWERTLMPGDTDIVLR